ncbi:helix-turn-helix domain-containing protein [uncultured Pseudodesulfovibrio sp.]|uniref:helix-turn-helix domain-containing protein n=1 Tax=uncultured Pseudodesulfovibrio sp. TaxID=2035858 RepID=UPI0029C64EFE|nr:helix-turn-helix domain-containing protein [uncultured Pseudodesulfovibrio sp.]
MNTSQAAEYLGLKKGTLEVWRCHGRGPRYAKLGARVVYSKSDLDLFVRSCKVQTVDMYGEEPLHLCEEGNDGN